MQEKFNDKVLIYHNIEAFCEYANEETFKFFLKSIFEIVLESLAQKYGDGEKIWNEDIIKKDIHKIVDEMLDYRNAEIVVKTLFKYVY